jgi:thiol:disulfide interchange protein
MTLKRRSVTAFCLGTVLLLAGGTFSGASGQFRSRTKVGSSHRATGKQQPVEKGTLDPVNNKTDLYPADADARKEISEALTQAVSEKKRVILVFGGNWCYDCHVLDRALHEGAAGKVVRESFLLVHVDIGEGDKNLDLVKKYKVPLGKGVPAVVILNGAGELLFSSADGQFEAARSMMKKDLLAFLNHWKVRAVARP